MIRWMGFINLPLDGGILGVLDFEFFVDYLSFSTEDFVLGPDQVDVVRSTVNVDGVQVNLEKFHLTPSVHTRLLELARDEARAVMEAKDEDE